MLTFFGMSTRDPDRQPRRPGRRRAKLPKTGVTNEQPLVIDGKPVRKVGAPLNITGAALRDVEDGRILSLLTPEQRAERRKLRKLQSQERKAIRKAHIEQGTQRQRAKQRPNAHRFCTGTNSKGKPCNNYRVYGSDFCFNHIDDEERQQLQLPPLRRRKGPVKAKAPEVMRQVVEAAVAKILEPYFTALGMEFVGYDDETGEPVIVHKGRGIMIHGESKDGDIIMTNYQNVTAMVAVAERLLDRVYGKPRQTTVLEGGAQPLKVSPVRTEERAREVADLLARSRAIPPPHDGRQRRDPASPTDPSSHHG